jgi:uncharacterized MAPEG superfamily protein
METFMLFEYQMLGVMTLFFLFAWLPSSVGKWKSFGPKWLASNREMVNGKEMVAWGARAERAHNNLKDYFPGFVVAIFLLGTLNKFDQSTAIASGIFVISRIVHLFSYVAGIVSLRALTYTLGMASNIYLLIKCFSF